jgi:serine/threonine protein kinase
LHDVGIEKRIGSESTYGEVYKVNIDGKAYALKVVLDTSDAIVNKTFKEIEIATFLGNQSSDFPKVFWSGQCKKVVGAYNQQLYADALEYAKRNKRLYPSAHIIISELAAMDVKQWRKQPHSEKEWIVMLKSIFRSIKKMHELGIIHNDLHLGNVLVKYDETPAIHDFGESMYVHDVPLRDLEPLVFNDYKKFIDSIAFKKYLNRFPPRIAELLMSLRRQFDTRILTNPYDVVMSAIKAM